VQTLFSVTGEYDLWIKIIIEVLFILGFIDILKDVRKHHQAAIEGIDLQSWRERIFWYKG